jgi:hypothetical protein
MVHEITGVNVAGCKGKPFRYRILIRSEPQQRAHSLSRQGGTAGVFNLPLAPLPEQFFLSAPASEWRNNPIPQGGNPARAGRQKIFNNKRILTYTFEFVKYNCFERFQGSSGNGLDGMRFQLHAGFKPG